MNKSEVMLLGSGGIDSTTLLAQWTNEGKRVRALSFDYGQRHSVELDYAGKNAEKYGVISHTLIKIDYKQMAHSNLLTDLQSDMSFEQSAGNNPYYVPGRNLLMLSYASAYAEAMNIQRIYFGANADDSLRFDDCSPDFLLTLNQLWKTCTKTKNIELLLPFITLNKVAVIEKAKELGVDLRYTISCYNPMNGIPCTVCLSCFLREEALNRAKARQFDIKQNKFF